MQALIARDSCRSTVKCQVPLCMFIRANTVLVNIRPMYSLLLQAQGLLFPRCLLWLNGWRAFSPPPIIALLVLFRTCNLISFVTMQSQVPEGMQGAISTHPLQSLLLHDAQCHDIYIIPVAVCQFVCCKLKRCIILHFVTSL